MADLRIDLAAEFRGRKAFKEADKSVTALDKAVGKLGKRLASVFAAQKIYQFSKESVKAFAADQAAATRLATAVDNLGLSFANPQLAQFVNELSQASGVSDDQLRPALQALLQQTGSLTNSQKLLTEAIDISRGSGIALGEVANDLAQAYVGNTKGLKKYYLGLTQAELKAMSFTDIQKKLNAQFSGASAAYLNTYAGKMEYLATAAGEAKETIGKGLVDALIAANGQSSNVQGLADTFQTLADHIATTLLGAGLLVDKLKELSGIKAASNAGFDWFKVLFPGYSFLSNLGKRSQSAQLAPSTSNTHLQDLTATANAAAQKKAERDAAKRAKDLAAATAKNTAELKKQAALKKAGTMFDLEQIGIIAALKGNISEDERNRLKLQLAILTENEKEASALTYQLAISQGLTVKMAQELASLPMANNPFAAWKGYLDEIELQAKRIASLSFGSSARTGFETLTPTVQSLVSGAATGIAGSNALGDVNITINGSVLSEQDLISAVQNGLQFNSLAGKPSDIGRIAGMFG